MINPSMMKASRSSEPDIKTPQLSGAVGCSYADSLFCNSLVDLLPIYRDFLRCIYPDSDLVACNGEDKSMH